MTSSNSTGSDAFAFLSCILPSEGYYCATVISGDIRKNIFRDSIEALSAVIREYDDAGYTVYHACATYREIGNGRKQVNVRRIRALWLDIDCGPGKPYANQNDAFGALAQFCQVTGLPEPVVVGSGMGLHCYWPFVEELGYAEWKPLADGLKQTCREHGLAANSSRTADAASVLRTPGTHWRKDGGERLVQVGNLVQYPVADFGVLLQNDRGGPDLRVEPHRAGRESGSFQPAEQLPSILRRPRRDIGASIGGDFPDCSFRTLSDRCLQVQAFYRSGDITEPEWHAHAGLAARCSDGEVEFHACSKNDFPAYNYAEAQRKLDTAGASTTGATTCKRFDDVNPGVCTSCPQRGKINSPISLGAEQQRRAVSRNDAPSSGVDGATDVRGHDGPSSIACTPNGQVVWCTEDPDGKPEYKKLLDAPAGLKGVQIGEADKGAHSYTFWHYAPHEGWKTFNLPAVAVFGSSGIAQFAEKGVTVHQPLMFFSALREAVDTYKRVKAMEIKYDQFGWKDGETKFLCGDRLYGAGTYESVSVSKVADGRVKYLQPVSTGSLGEWRSAATSFFKPGFEAQALTLVAGLAAPLISFIDRSEGGIFLHLFSAASGAGKSLGLMASCSIYGLEKGLRLIKGDTPVAKAIAMGVLCNLPIIYDEIMDQDPEAIRKQVDVFRDGRDRSRGTVDGTIRQVQSSWTTVQISAGNGSLFDLLSTDGTDAPVFRVFEIEPRLPSGTDAAYGNRIRKQLLDNAGHAGDIYLRYLTSPRVVDWVKARLDRRIEDVWDQLGPVRDQRQRIRVHFLACLWVACDVVTGIGLLEFDVGRIMAYAFQEMDRMVSGTSEQKDAIAQAPDLLGRFLNEHIGEVLTVAEPFRHGKQCSVMGRPPLRRVIMRHELASSRLLIAVKPFGDWMIKHTRLPARDAATALEKLGVVTRKKHRATLGAGTDFASAPVDCIELDMAHPMMSGKLRVVASHQSSAGDLPQSDSPPQ